MPTVSILEYVVVFGQIIIGSFDIMGEQTGNGLYVLLKHTVNYSAIVFDWKFSEAYMKDREIWLYAVGVA
jgi:hypothetical protein